MPRKKIKLITLDLDDTVWPNHKVILDAEKTLWTYVKNKTTSLDEGFGEKEINKIRLELLEQDPLIKFDLTRFRKEIVRQIFLQDGKDDAEANYYSNEAFSEFFKVRNKVHLYKDAKLGLERLSRKTMVGSLSNGNADLSIIGISSYFSFSVISSDVNSNKPSPGHFLKALEIAKCDASEALHIGDCPVNDVGGARNCNFNTIWFNCDRKKWDEIFPCELQAKNWKELNEVINKNFLLEKDNV